MQDNKKESLWANTDSVRKDHTNMISRNQAARKYCVVYEIGNPDYTTPERHEVETTAVNPQKAINNAWYRCGRDPSFFLRQVREVG